MSSTPAPNATIIALASGQGRAGVAVIRVSGPEAGTLLERLAGVRPAPRLASVRAVRDPATGENLDEALALWMPGPNSFTGEDVAELHLHGGPAIIESVVRASLSTGLCRLAEPGEFTRRAFEAGRLSLLEAEAVADLIDAETEAQRRQAARIYQGEADRVYEGWRELLIRAMADLEAAIDFPDEEDIAAGIVDRAMGPMAEFGAELDRALAGADMGRAVREGFRIAILGPPNAGKSSLLNRIAGREAAIVSPIPGTTRDVVEVRLVLAGFPVWIADTAGLREAADQIEAEGVRRSLVRAEEADLRIWVQDVSRETLDSEEPDSGVSRETLIRPASLSPSSSGASSLSSSGVSSGAPATDVRPGDLVVLNKADLAPPDVLSGGSTPEGVLAVSAQTGAGVEALLRRITEEIVGRMSAMEAPTITRTRHRLLVEEAAERVRAAIAAHRAGRGPELISEELRLAARALGQVIGVVDVEDLLDRIFSEFCIGK
ncbi:MAG: tRNA uridine-5-carboxymethylaminomethyl(34) synthesis GTPase MnmE [Hyphomonadaceae bacterium]